MGLPLSPRPGHHRPGNNAQGLLANQTSVLVPARCHTPPSNLIYTEKAPRARPSYGRTLHPSTTDDGDNHPHWELFVACHICGVTKIIHVPDGCNNIDSEAVGKICSRLHQYVRILVISLISYKAPLFFIIISYTAPVFWLDEKIEERMKKLMVNLIAHPTLF